MSRFDYRYCIACPRCDELSLFAYKSPFKGKVYYCCECKVDNDYPLRWHEEAARLWEEEETPEASQMKVKVIMASSVEPEYFKW